MATDFCAQPFNLHSCIGLRKSPTRNFVAGVLYNRMTALGRARAGVENQEGPTPATPQPDDLHPALAL
jgi:hypothetical protein